MSKGVGSLRGYLFFHLGYPPKKPVNQCVKLKRQKTSLVLAKRIMGFESFALEAGQKHKSKPYVFSLISCNYYSLREGFVVLRCMFEEADTVGQTNTFFCILWSVSYCVQYIIFQFSQFPCLQPMKLLLMMLAMVLDHSWMSFSISYSMCMSVFTGFPYAINVCIMYKYWPEFMVILFMSPSPASQRNKIPVKVTEKSKQ